MSGSGSGAVGPALLATKLHPPRRRRGVVARPRLTERVAADDPPALTLVSAPAGFGKTTLLAEWIVGATNDHRRAAWLALDARDNDPAGFWTYVVGGLQTAVPEAGEDALALLRASEPMASVVSSLVNDLACVPGDVILVLDDYHVIESAEVHDAMAFLVEHVPPQVHLVIAGRADPPLPL